MSRRIIGIAIAVAGLLAAPLRAQVAVDPIFTQLSYSTRVQIQALMDSATQLGLPAEHLRQLALQGKARNSAEKEIVRRVRERLGELQRAQRVLGRDASGAELVAAVDALRANIRDADVAQFAKDARDRSVVAVLTILTDLVNSRGVPMDEATSSMLRLWRSGANDEMLNGLWHRIGEDILNGTSSRDAFQARVRAAIPPSRPPET